MKTGQVMWKRLSFFIANETETENKKKAILLSCCGVVTYCLFKSLVAPRNP